MKHKCRLCGYVYNSELGDKKNNIPPGTDFKNLPDNWVCPICGAGKEYFISERFV